MQFQVSVEREKQAFEKLIYAKSHMVLPEVLTPALPGVSVTPTGSKVSTRTGGTSENRKVGRKILVDMREFRSQLPSMLHQRGFDTVPVTLTVGDYVLSPDICVERKSVADLFGSLNSGRLFQQAEKMSKFYRRPCLLIEFDEFKSFSFFHPDELPQSIVPTHIVSKLSLLFLHFPQLRVLWSRSPTMTSHLFEILKSNGEEPDVQRAMAAGSVEAEDAEEKNVPALEILRKLPGVNEGNVHNIMSRCRCLADLFEKTDEELCELLGNGSNARKFRTFVEEYV